MDTEHEYRGYTIRVIPDDCPENPWEVWDGQPPLLAAHCGRHSADITGHGLDRTPPTLTREQTKANGAAIARELDARSLLDAIEQYAPYRLATYATATEAVNHAISEYADGIGNGSDLTAFLAKCWRWAECVALDTCSTGYSQGDYVDLLLVATPEWLQATGVGPGDTLEQLQHAAELYGHWCWGNVYGYQVVDPEGVEIEDGSCWGYYGDPEDSGLLDDARAAVDYAIAQKRREHLKKVRAYIKNRVPLHARTA